MICISVRQQKICFGQLEVLDMIFLKRFNSDAKETIWYFFPPKPQSSMLALVCFARQKVFLDVLKQGSETGLPFGLLWNCLQENKWFSHLAIFESWTGGRLFWKKSEKNLQYFMQISKMFHLH